MSTFPWGGTPRINIVHGDIFSAPANALVLKYARRFYGADKKACELICDTDPSIMLKMPVVGSQLIVRRVPGIAADNIIFIGAPELLDFGYDEIRKFARKSIQLVAQEIPRAGRLLLTLHGAGYGLDEGESLRSMVLGFSEAVAAREVSSSLRDIDIVEKDLSRVNRLRQFLVQLPSEMSTVPPHESKSTREASDGAILSTSHREPNSLFVAMPFERGMDDIYFYGICGAAHSCGYLCERADMVPFAGDIMDWIKRRIQSAHYIVADLTGANANVYLELGYAWGLKKTTILLTQCGQEVKFDVQGHKYIEYKSIRDLQVRLEDTLRHLDSVGRPSSTRTQADDQPSRSR